LPALLSAVLGSFWLALLLPPEGSPPPLEMLTGTLAFVSLCVAFASDSAACNVADP
jgi:hypothetical protein